MNGPLQCGTKAVGKFTPDIVWISLYEALHEVLVTILADRPAQCDSPLVLPLVPCTTLYALLVYINDRTATRCETRTAAAGTPAPATFFNSNLIKLCERISSTAGKLEYDFRVRHANS